MKGAASPHAESTLGVPYPIPDGDAFLDCPAHDCARFFTDDAALANHRKLDH